MSTQPIGAEAAEAPPNRAPADPTPGLRPTPYVGISGIVSPDQAGWLLGWAHALGFAGRRDLLLGVKATHKTQWLDVENRYNLRAGSWYPVGADAFAEALRDPVRIDPDLKPPRMRAVAQVHLDVDHVDDRAYREQFVARIAERGRAWLTGLQFDVLPWHEAPWAADFLAETRLRHDLPILLQAHGPAMTTLTPEALAERLVPLAPVVDHVLFDASHGTGTRLDPDVLAPYLRAAVEHPGLTGMGLGVAGGLSQLAVVEDLPALLCEFPDLSFDAEGALHHTQDGRLGLLAAAGYLRAAAQALGLPGGAGGERAAGRRSPV